MNFLVAERSKEEYHFHSFFSKLTLIWMLVKPWVPMHSLGWEVRQSSTGECLDLWLQWEIDSRDFPFHKALPQKSPLQGHFPLGGWSTPLNKQTLTGTLPKVFGSLRIHISAWLSQKSELLLFFLFCIWKSFETFYML